MSEYDSAVCRSFFDRRYPAAPGRRSGTSALYEHHQQPKHERGLTDPEQEHPANGDRLGLRDFGFQIPFHQAHFGAHGADLGANAPQLFLDTHFRLRQGLLKALPAGLDDILFVGLSELIQETDQIVGGISESSVPAPVVLSLSEELVYVQLTESSDYDPEELTRVRAAVSSGPFSMYLPTLAIGKLMLPGGRTRRARVPRLWPRSAS